MIQKINGWRKRFKGWRNWCFWLGVKFDFFLRAETPRFTEHVEKLFSNLETIKSVQEYFLSNDSLIEHVFDYFDSLVQANELFLNYIRNWIKVALYNNMPDMFSKDIPLSWLKS